jgi:hypothetical protein
VRDAMIDLSFIGIRFSSRLGDTFGDNFFVASFVASEFAISTLHTSGIFEQLSTQSATHDVVELLLDKFVSILFMDFFLLLTNSTLTTKSKISCFISVLFV